MKNKQQVARNSVARFLRLGLVIAGATIAGIFLLSSQAIVWAHAQRNSESVHPVIAQSLPRMDGAHLVVKVAAVSYRPGGYSSPHSHSCPVIAVVVEGAIRSEVKGQPEKIYRPGEAFYEAPNGVHLISSNANKTKPAKMLAFFVCDHDAPLTIAVPKENH